jgi:hypothetical protein
MLSTSQNTTTKLVNKIRNPAYNNASTASSQFCLTLPFTVIHRTVHVDVEWGRGHGATNPSHLSL